MMRFLFHGLWAILCGNWELIALWYDDHFPVSSDVHRPWRVRRNLWCRLFDHRWLYEDAVMWRCGRCSMTKPRDKLGGLRSMGY